MYLTICFLNSVGSECHPYKVEVVGSTPTGSTKCSFNSVWESVCLTYRKSGVQTPQGAQQPFVVELVYTHVLGTCVARLVGSSPTERTNANKRQQTLFIGKCLKMRMWWKW